MDIPEWVINVQMECVNFDTFLISEAGKKKKLTKLDINLYSFRNFFFKDNSWRLFKFNESFLIDTLKND